MTRVLSCFLGLSLVVAAGCGKVTAADDDDTIDVDAFASTPDPTISSISPARGPLAGGTTVTMTGTGFVDNGAGTNMVIVGGRAASDVTVSSDTEMTFVTPSGSDAGAADVTAFNSAGPATTAGAFSYNPLPTAASVVPDKGPVAGGDTITITGSGFMDLEAGTNVVTFGGVAGTGVTVTSDTSLTVVLPVYSGAPFVVVDVQLSNANGAATVAESFLFHKSGLLASVNWNPVIGGDAPTLYWIDPATADTIRLGALDIATRGITGMAVAPNGVVWAITTMDPNTGGERRLLQIDPFTLGVVDVGPLVEAGTNRNVGVQALTFVSGQLIGVVRNGTTDRRLVRISMVDGTWSFIGTTPFAASLQGVGLVSKGVGVVWLVNRFDTPIRSVSTNSGIMTDGSTLTGGTNRSSGLARFGGVIYSITRGRNDDNSWPLSELTTVDPATGAINIIGELPDWLDAVTETPF